MQGEARPRRMEAVRAHPLTELLECPPAIAAVLNSSAQCLSFGSNEAVFRQSEPCRGLFLLLAGTFQRRADRMETRLTLTPARAGELVELAALLGEGGHTYTLTAQGPGSALMLPIDALRAAFESYPPMRMRLLEELAREVSRAYSTCCFSRFLGQRRGISAA